MPVRHGWLLLPIVAMYWIARAPIPTWTKVAAVVCVVAGCVAAVIIGFRIVSFEWVDAEGRNPELVPFSRKTKPKSLASITT